MNNLEGRTLTEVPVVVLDTETTGLSPARGHRIIEVAAIRLDKWREVDRIDQLINPGRSIAADASRVNGLYDEDVAGAPRFNDIAASLLQLLDGAVVVAHNAHFDASFLGMEYTMLDRDWDPYHTLRNPWLCTLQLAQRFFYFERNNLAQIAHELGVPANPSHRALNDVFTTIEIFKRMTRELQKRRLHTVGDYLKAQGGPIHIPSHDPSLPPALVQALKRHLLLLIRYRTKGKETERVIRPLYPTHRHGNVYIVAYCRLRQSRRTFRVDRITSLELLGREEIM